MGRNIESFDLRKIRNHDFNLATDERVAAVKMIRSFISDYYVHLPQKISSMAINPLRELELLGEDAPFIPSSTAFLNRLDGVFVKLRDRHTVMRRPSPWSAMIAFLPVVLESCYEHGRRKMLVSKVTDEKLIDKLQVGQEVTHWNGTPIGKLVENYSWQTSGSNPYARIALAIRGLTLRPLSFAAVPDEDWVTLSLVDSVGRTYHISIPWRVSILPPRSSSGVALLSSASSLGDLAYQVGLDDHMGDVNSALLDFFSNGSPAKFDPKIHKDVEPLKMDYVDLSEAGAHHSVLSGRVAAATISKSSGESFGYLRIFSFGVDDVRSFCEGISFLVKELPKRGLIVDVRANPGGTIPAGEAILNVISDKAISHTRNIFRATDSLREISSRVAFFDRWARSLDLVYESGQQYSQGFPLTSPEHYAGLEGSYRGPLVVVFDALSYSTTDYFVAGFEDNGLGKLLGVDPTSGAGGANVWSLNQIVNFSNQAQSTELGTLPGGLDFRVAVRRAQRTGSNIGLPLEGIGATADQVHLLTRRDILGQNEDLLLSAISLLDGK